MGAIRNGGLPTAPEKGQLKPRVLRNHIAQGGFQFGGRNMLGVQPAQDLPANRARGMARRLGGPQFTGIAEDGEDIAQHGIGEFRVGPGGRPKMAGIADPILHILEDIEEMPLGQRALSKASSVARSSGTGCAGSRLRCGVPVRINGQRGVVGVRRIDPLGHLPQAFAQGGDETPWRWGRTAAPGNRPVSAGHTRPRAAAVGGNRRRPRSLRHTHPHSAALRRDNEKTQTSSCRRLSTIFMRRRVRMRACQRTLAKSSAISAGT